MSTPNENTRPVSTPPPILPPVEDRFQLRPMEGPCHALAVLENLLKSPGRILHELKMGRAGAVGLALVLVGVVCLAVYGCVVGSLTGGTQFLIAPAKILLGSVLCVLICLPSLYIFLCLGGTDAKLRTVAGELLAAVCLTALLLIGFAPVAWVFSQSTDSVALMMMLHLFFWTIALWFGLRLLGRSMGPRGAGHLPVWIIIYVVVCLQMMTALRPIIGSGSTFFPQEKKFFLAHAMDVLGGNSAVRK